jgi:hypothetical protein
MLRNGNYTHGGGSNEKRVTMSVCTDVKRGVCRLRSIRQKFSPPALNGLRILRLKKKACMKEEMRQKGMIYIEDVDFKAFQENACPAIDRVCKDFEPWVYEELLKIIAKP